MKPAIWSVPAIVMGLALAFLGPIVAGWIVPVESLWSDADAGATSKAAAELHAALHDHAGHNHVGHNHAGHEGSGAQLHEAATGQDRLATAQAESDRQTARLDDVIARHGWMLLAVRVLGMLLAGAGVAGAIVARQSQ
jgi:hypothetical protein